jgi:hypothetical protein
MGMRNSCLPQSKKQGETGFPGPTDFEICLLTGIV